MEGEGIGENPYCLPHSELAEEKKNLCVDELRVEKRAEKNTPLSEDAV